jgi:hypothetical protein
VKPDHADWFDRATLLEQVEHLSDHHGNKIAVFLPNRAGLIEAHVDAHDAEAIAQHGDVGNPGG